MLSKIFDPFPKKTNFTFFGLSSFFKNNVLISSNSSVLEKIIFFTNSISSCLKSLSLFILLKFNFISFALEISIFKILDISFEI